MLSVIMTLEEIKNTLLPILSTNKTVGFFVSGGFDSALMLYVCSLICQEENLSTDFIVFTVPRHDDSITHSKRVINWVTKKFNSKIKTFMIGDPDLHHSDQVWSGVVPALNLCPCIILSDTANPSCLPNGPVRTKVVTPGVIQPFIDVTKKDTVALAIHLGLTDLMEITHTCTESKFLRCNQCWQCRERAWGFAENNYIDLGNM
jgi:hypothetical protein